MQRGSMMHRSEMRMQVNQLIDKARPLCCMKDEWKFFRPYIEARAGMLVVDDRKFLADVLASEIKRLDKEHDWFDG